jgi:hypothetical protein
VARPSPAVTAGAGATCAPPDHEHPPTEAATPAAIIHFSTAPPIPMSRNSPRPGTHPGQRTAPDRIHFRAATGDRDH